MNIVKQIVDQLSGGVLGELGSQIGADAETVQRAASAAVPSLLSALSGLASSEDGAKRLTNALGGLETTAVGDFAQALSGNAGSLLSKGQALLASLFGDGGVANLSGAIARFTGLSNSAITSLLGYLAPLVLGKVAAQWKRQGGTTQALKSLFIDQRDNIANAVPAGLSLSGIPGAPEARRATHAVPHERELAHATAGSPARWLLPLALALLGGFLLWQLFNRPRDREMAGGVDRSETNTTNRSDGNEVTSLRPELPAVGAPSLTTVRQDLAGLFTSFETALTDIRDEASAANSMTVLRELETKVDAMDRTLAALPETSRETLRPVIEERLRGARTKADTASSVVGVGDEIKALIQQILNKCARWIESRTG